jgi:hypothetical protein
MKITVHAGERFLQRVMEKETYTCFDINFAIGYLEKLLRDVVPTGKESRFVLPGFENYRAIYRDGTVITIIPKGDQHA